MTTPNIEIISPYKKFDFNRVHMEDLMIISKPGEDKIYGADIYTRNERSEKSPLYLQLTECNTRNGIVADSKYGKYIEVLFDRKQNAEFGEWIEQFEYRCHDIIHEHKNEWFSNSLTLDDIALMTEQIIRLFNSGKAMSFRAVFDIINNDIKCETYDEKHNKININSITHSNVIIPLVQIEKIMFIKGKIEFRIKVVQTMVLGIVNDTQTTGCLIRRNNPAIVADTKPVHNEVKNVPIVESIKEINITPDDNLETIKIKNMDSIYSELYSEAKNKMLAAQNRFLRAYKKVSVIKNEHNIHDSDDEDDGDDGDDDEDDEDEDGDEDGDEDDEDYDEDDDEDNDDGEGTKKINDK